ncbi:uncharacterized protein IWZ02DRAFT_430861 [Phyllosticta citriasiana]|uniref:uncharacterized protein n=1 Tax=Phyllosticta citriasiana TaxID=595635 RepID=UPI0030FD4396
MSRPSLSTSSSDISCQFLRKISKTACSSTAAPTSTTRPVLLQKKTPSFRSVARCNSSLQVKSKVRTAKAKSKCASTFPAPSCASLCPPRVQPAASAPTGRAAGTDITVAIPPALQWPALTAQGRDGARARLSRLVVGGVRPGCVGRRDARRVKAAFNADERAPQAALPAPPGPCRLALLVLGLRHGVWPRCGGVGRAGVGVCFFADQQVDRSPTGSGVQARVALAVPKGERSMGQGWTYHSLLSRASEGAKGGFVGTPVEEAAVGGERGGVKVEVSGWANYTGMATWVLEKDDDLVGEGFDFEALGARSRLEN